jgi:hypothetical protein
MSTKLHARSAHEAEIQALVRALRSYGILTREGLREASHGTRWNGSFDLALGDGLRDGRIKRIGHDLYELGVDQPRR